MNVTPYTALAALQRATTTAFEHGLAVRSIELTNFAEVNHAPYLTIHVDTPDQIKPWVDKLAVNLDVETRDKVIGSTRFHRAEWTVADVTIDIVCHETVVPAAAVSA